jgi:hypothetical protein
MDPHRTRGRRAVAIAALCALAGAPRYALAEPPAKPPPVAPAEIAGTVVGLDADDLLVDLGTADGLADGAVVEIWRPIKIKHPVSGKTISDRFRIGALEIVQARRNLSLASPSGALSRKPERGDVILVSPTAPAAPAATPVEQAAPAPAAPPSPEEAEAREIAAMIEALKGADLSSRIRRYEEVARAHPQGKYTRTLLEEAAALRELFKQSPRQDRAEAAPEIASFTPPADALAGAPLRIGVEIRGAVAGAVLHARDRGAPSYRSFPMTPDGKGYWGATLPAERVNAPSLEYFIEAVAPSGAGTPIAGHADAPDDVDVHPVPKPRPPSSAGMTASLATDYADYNRFRGNDRAWQTEGYFGMRFGDTGIRALRTGFGVFRGVGGSVNELDVERLAGRSVGLTYGYLETEVGAHKSFSILGRLAVGLLDQGISGGGQLLFRIGNDRRTNLLLGGEVLGGVGLRSIVELNLLVFPRFPILLRNEVTNQPAGSSGSADAATASGTSQVGARGIAQLGWKVTPALTVAVRGSFQGRTITHAGPGLGAGVSYEW